MYEALTALHPVVRHAYRELRAGVPVEHALWEAAVGGMFVGAGLTAREALRATERLEQIYLVPGMIHEPLRYHMAEVGVY